MAVCDGCMAALVCLTLLVLHVSEGVVITEIRVPKVVEHDTNSTAILDCDYDFMQDDIRFVVVKWYFNDERNQVYQWGLGLPPSDSGVLKGRTHLGHVASPDPLKKHRAISVSNPTIELTGDYICKVMTNQEVVTASAKMIVYAPARTMNFTQEKPTTSSVNLSCLAEGVFPIPKMEILAELEGNPDSRKSLQDVDVQVQSTEDGFFEVFAHREVLDDELEGPTVFTCLLSLYDAPYSLRRKLSYSSDKYASLSSNTGHLSSKRTEFDGMGLPTGSNSTMEGAVLAASISGAADTMKSASAGLVISAILLAAACNR